MQPAALHGGVRLVRLTEKFTEEEEGVSSDSSGGGGVGGGGGGGSGGGGRQLELVGKVVASCQSSKTPVTALSFSPDGRCLAAGSHGGGRRYNTRIQLVPQPLNLGLVTQPLNPGLV
jgi:hypothetical protein